MKVEETNISGCYILKPEILDDQRGKFIKIFHKHIFEKFKLHLDYPEEYYSVSKHKVLRGLHFQVPPEEHFKIVQCLYGKIFDVTIDLRKKSKSYGHTNQIILNDENSYALYIPPGIAHGFYVTSEKSIVLYKVSTIYSKTCDQGILWNSIDNINWPDKTPIISDRDKNFPPIPEFKNPF